MKRFLFLAILVAVCLGLVAVPLAAAQEPMEPTMFFVGIWYGSPDQGAPFDQDYIWATDATDPYTDYVGRLPSAVKLAAGEDVLMPYGGWGCYGKGRIQTLPNYLLVTVDIYQAQADGSLGTRVAGLTAKQAKAFWLDPELQDPDPWMPFNPNVGAKPYWRWWAWSAPQLAAGNYLMRFTQDFRHPTFDLSIVRESKPGPYKFMPGDKDWSYHNWYAFTVLQ